MKSRFDFKSIKFRVWILLLAFTLIILGLIWFLQIFFVNNYFTSMKVKATTTSAKELVAEYNKGDWDSFKEKADNITSDNDVFVRIDKNGETIYPEDEQQQLYTAEITAAHKKLMAQIKDGNSNIYTVIKNNDLKQARTFVYSSTLDKDSSATIYVVSPLYPVKSTVDILQNQMIYVIFIALALAFIVSYFLSTRITTPIISLTKSAKKLAEGDYGTTIRTKTNFSELQNLSNTLNIASRELEKTALLQKDLMANVSHDLRTPLTMIKSYAEMIRDISGDNPEKREAHIEVIIEEADRLSNLVTDVMEYSAMQAGTQQVNIGTFNIKDAVDTIVATYEPIRQQKDYIFEINCREDFIVVGDEDKIKQVISNLFTNAIKYCGKDKKIVLNVKRWGQKIHFEIIDHGVGIKPEELDHIWERYYKSSSNHVRTTSGSGLGLSIVNEILTLHNAKFGAESKVNHGTTFWFELELAPSYDATQSQEEKKRKSLMRDRFINK